jgi:hypothetical protein
MLTIFISLSAHKNQTRPAAKAGRAGNYHYLCDPLYENLSKAG